MNWKKTALITGGSAILLGLLLGKKWVKPIDSKVTGKFGYRIDPITHQSIFHNGVDVHAPMGTEIIAPADGTIETIYTNEAGGLQMLVRHKNGYRTGYAHLGLTYQKAGDRVRQGQKIALSGNSGITTAPHLHFTLYDSGNNPLDPEKYIYT